MTTTSTPDFTVRAVLWDMDGTLMDSQPFWDEAFIHHCQALGGNPRPELVARMTGASIRTARELIAAVVPHRRGQDHPSLRLSMSPCSLHSQEPAAPFGFPSSAP